MTNKTKLLPCPFCGCETTLLTGREDIRIAGRHGKKCPFLDLDVMVDSREAWNTRAPAEDVRAVGEEPVYQVCNGVSGWIDVDLLRYTACQLDPEEYETRVLFVRPQRPVVLPALEHFQKWAADEKLERTPYWAWRAAIDSVEELNK